MKKILQSMSGLLMMLALAVAVLWLVQNAPNSSQELSTQTNITPTSPQPTQWKTVTPVPDTMAIAQAITTSTVEVIPTSETETIEAVTKLSPTTTQVSVLEISTLRVDKVEKISTGPYNDMVFSPDGKKTLFVKQYISYYLVRRDEITMRAALGDIWLRDLSTGTERQLVQKAGRYVWSPDSAQIAWLAPTKDEGIAGALYVMDIASAETKQVAEADFLGSDYAPQWLPTGELIYVRDGQLWATSVNGDTEKALPFKFYNRVAAHAGKEIYIADRQGLIGYHFSPTGQKIAYLTLNEGERTIVRQLWLADANGNNAQLITQQAESSYYEWSPDGKWLIFNTFRGIDDTLLDTRDPGLRELWIIKVDDLNTHSIYKTDNWRPILSPAWSPNSTMIIFIEEEILRDDIDITTRKLWFADIVGNQIKQLPEANPDKAIIRQVWWAPDGKSLYTMQDGKTPGSYQSNQLRLTSK